MPATAKRTRRSSGAKKPRQDAYEVATTAVLEALERGTIPWRKPWQDGPAELPTNALTGKPYRGMNVLFLWMAGYASPYWITYKQAESAGAQVRKGEKSTPGVFWKRLRIAVRTREDEEKARAEGRQIQTDEHGHRYYEAMMARLFRVFNAEQVDGLNTPQTDDVAEPGWTPDERAEQIVTGYRQGPTLGEGGNHALYAPDRDHVQMPARGQFDRAADWYPTLLHELTHSTGHPSRLRRDLSGGMGSQSYAREELTAEMGAAMLCAVAGVATAELTDRHAAYVEHWRQRIGEDPKLVMLAAQRAQKACDRILGHDQDDGEQG